MGQEEVNKIKALFSKLNLNAEYLEHEPVVTSEQAAKIRGFELKQGIKAILFTNGEDFVVVDVPGDQKVNQKAVALHMQWPKGKTRMATPEEVLEITGCEIGSVPPLCHRNKIRILADNKIFDNEICDFNVGLLTTSAKIQASEMKKALENSGAIFGEFAKT